MNRVVVVFSLCFAMVAAVWAQQTPPEYDSEIVARFPVGNGANELGAFGRVEDGVVGWPTDLTYVDGHWYLYDFWNDRVLILDEQFERVREIPVPGVEEILYTTPRDLLVHDGVLYYHHAHWSLAVISPPEVLAVNVYYSAPEAAPGAMGLAAVHGNRLYYYGDGDQILYREWNGDTITRKLSRYEPEEEQQWGEFELRRVRLVGEWVWRFFRNGEYIPVSGADFVDYLEAQGAQFHRLGNAGYDFHDGAVAFRSFAGRDADGNWYWESRGWVFVMTPEGDYIDNFSVALEKYTFTRAAVHPSGDLYFIDGTRDVSEVLIRKVTRRW
jgi:hypothetical protein